MNIKKIKLISAGEEYEAEYVNVLLAHHDNIDEAFEARIQLSSNDFSADNPAYDDKVFLYCDSVKELHALCEPDNGEDFRIIEIL
jgi:hypothetical protein